MENKDKTNLKNDQIKQTQSAQRDLLGIHPKGDIQKKSRYHPLDKFQDRYLVEAERFAQIGLPERQMAWCWGVSEDSITR